MARARRQLPVGGERAGWRSAAMSVWPSTCSAQSISLGICRLELDDGRGELVDGGEALRRQRRLSRTGTAPRTGTRSGRRRRGCPCGPSAARAGGRRSRSDSAAAPAPGGRAPTLRRAPRSVMRVWLSLSFFSEARSASLQRRDLAAQREQLLVEQIDLGQRLVGDLLLAVELGRRARRCARPRPSAFSSPDSAEPDELGVLLACSVDERRLQRGQLVLGRSCALPFSSDSRLVSSAICRVRRFSAVSLPLASWLAKYCASMKIDIRKVTTSSSVDSTST